MVKGKYANKREQILKAAKTLFLTHGYRDCSMDTITNKAKVSKRTVYQYFQTKMQLFNAVVVEHWQLLLTDPKLSIDNKQPIAKVLTYFANELIKFFFSTQTITLFRIIIAESNRFPDLVQALAKEGKAPATYHLIDYLKQQAHLKNLSIHNPVLAAQQFMGLIKESLFWPTMLGFRHGDAKANQTEIIQAAVAMFLNYYQSDSMK